jgi:hypothetical protein
LKILGYLFSVKKNCGYVIEMIRVMQQMRRQFRPADGKAVFRSEKKRETFSAAPSASRGKRGNNHQLTT